MQIPMSEEDFKMVYVPPGFANGHLCLSHKCIFHYKQTEYYEKDSQFTVAWNDPELGIAWPIERPIISVRDSTGPFLNME
jgi:dTDP-4-dehydrorhamnose 3,5-epimerase